MKTALVYDYLNAPGGGERLLGIVARMFPQAPIYALMHDPGRFSGAFPGHEIVTSVFDCAPLRAHHRAIIPLMPLMAGAMRVGDGYDTVVSLSAGYGKGIRMPDGARHLSYCFTPLRYAWEEGLLPFRGRGSGALRALASPVAACLRGWDRRAAQKPDRIATLSDFIAGKIRRHYGRAAETVYPPVDRESFFFDPKARKGEYFLAAGRLMQYKKFDLVIAAFNELRLPLVIAGAGPDYARLKTLVSSPFIAFAGFVPDEGLRSLYAGARAFVFPQVEDFGLVGIEAIACGTPVIAIRAGGAAEIVEEGETGMFFEAQSPEALVLAVRRFVAQEGDFVPSAVARHAEKFSLGAFQAGLTRQISLMHSA